MQRSKSVALIVLLAALVVGGALGFSADRLVTGDVCRGSAGQQDLRRYLARRLELTPAQRVAVDHILDRRHRDFVAVMTPVRPRLDSIRDAARTDIARQLDARQRTELQQIIQESERQEKSNHR